MTDHTERNLGTQPLTTLMLELNLNPHDLVAASTEQLTHKMVSRGMKGRRLTSNSKGIVQRALNQAAGRSFRRDELFNY